MQESRVIHAAHLLASVFVLLLLVGARRFLATQPFVSAILLLLFVPVYYTAARVRSFGRFLYPAAFLLVLAWALVLHGAGVPLALQPVGAILPIIGFYWAGETGVPRRVENSAAVLGRVNDIIIAVFSLWIVVRFSWFLKEAPWGAGAALAVYSVFLWLRFTDNRRIAWSAASVLLASGAFYFVVLWQPRIALLVTSLALVGLVVGLAISERLEAVETIGFSAPVAFFGLTGMLADVPMVVPSAWLGFGLAWLLLSIWLYEPERTPLMSENEGSAGAVSPHLIAGILSIIVPIFVFDVWRNDVLFGAWLASLFLGTLVAGRVFGENAVSLIEVLFARVLGVLSRVAAPVFFVFVLLHGVTGSFRLAIIAFFFAAISLSAGWQTEPRVFTRRNARVWEGGALLALGWFLAVHRLSSSSWIELLLASGAPLVFLLLLESRLSERRERGVYGESLADSAVVASILASVLAVVASPDDLIRAGVIGGILLLATAAAFYFRREPSTLYSVPVVLGYWMYMVARAAGGTGELLGVPYLVVGLLSAWVGYGLLARDRRWHRVLQFMWFLCTAVALFLFAPFSAIGAWLAPLWAVSFVLVARGRAARRDAAFANGLEIAGGILAAASLAVLIWRRIDLAAATALCIYALTWGLTGILKRVYAYLYPATLAAVAALFFVARPTTGEEYYLTWVFPLGAAFLAVAMRYRRRDRKPLAIPWEISTLIATVAGAALFLLLPFGEALALGVLTGAAWLVIFGMVTLRAEEYLAAAGLAAAFVLYELLPLFQGVSSSNRLAVFAPVAIVLAVAGRLLQQRGREIKGWAAWGAATTVAVLASVFAVWPGGTAVVAARIVLVIAALLWALLLAWSQKEGFVYLATLTLAILTWSFVASSSDLFGRHLFAFFVVGVALLGAIFLASALRTRFRFREPTLYAPSWRWSHRFLYLVPVAILGVAVFGSWGVTTSSNPYFCGSCHDMGTYFANWKDSPHARAEVSCDRCHYEPGVGGFVRAKIRGTSELVTTLTGTQRPKPVAEVTNDRCLACHPMAKLGKTIRVADSWNFNHVRHLAAPLTRGPAKLRCTSCHTDVGSATHFAVDTNACFTCHFETSASARLAASVGCIGCHDLPGSKSRFDHVAAGIERNDDTCASCHDSASRGTMLVEIRQCRHCHEESGRDLLNAADVHAIHDLHVTGKGVGCDWCHGVIQHEKVDTKLAMK
ncbi:MAG: NapC/NirT family cytochrome c [Thermoanaerobaculia bacterium]